jgi:hypothetical protein
VRRSVGGVIRDELQEVTEGQRWTLGLVLLSFVLFVSVGLPTTRILPSDSITGSLRPPGTLPAGVLPTPDPVVAIPYLAPPGSRGGPAQSGLAPDFTQPVAPPAPVSPAPTASASPAPPSPGTGCDPSLPLPSPVPLPPGAPSPSPVPLPQPVCRVCVEPTAVPSPVPVPVPSVTPSALPAPLPEPTCPAAASVVASRHAVTL